MATQPHTFTEPYYPAFGPIDPFEIDAELQSEAEAREWARIGQELLAPFLDAKLNLQRDDSGYYIPRTVFVDIREPGVEYRDADVRAVEADGVTVFSSSANYLRLLPWADVWSITIRSDQGAITYRAAQPWRVS